MSNSNSASMRVVDRIKTGSSRGIFIIFALVISIASVLFFLFLDKDQQNKSEQLIEKASFREELATLKNNLEAEAQYSLKSSLLFNISNKEIDRFQTIYSLKTTKDLFEEYSNISLNYIEKGELEDAFIVLRQLLAEYDQLIAESINRDGRLVEIIRSTIQLDDSTQTTLLINEAEIGIDLAEVKTLDLTFERIKNQLLLIDSQLKIQLNEEVEAIKAKASILLYVVFAVIIVLLVSFLGFIVARNQHASISELSEVLDHISKGELPDEDLDKKGDFKKIVDASKQLVNYLGDASQFAIKIGDGDFGYEFKPKSENDALGNSLINMRNRLQEVTDQDKIRNWVNEGQAKFGELLRQHSDDIESLGSHVITNLVEYLGASQGALFVVKEEENENYLELLSAYAYKRKKFINKKIEIGEGLAGQSFEERKTIYLTDIKTDHYDIQTGLGKSRPSCLLIVPLKEEERIEGIIEIASLKDLDTYQIEFVESIGSSLASSLSAGKSNQRSKKLLEETQEKAEEMKAQEEELRQNMEELAATQEQMERRNKEMEEIQQQLSEEKYLLNALLNSTHDHIYFKDLDSKFIRVSNSMVKLFGKENEGEILGKSDFDFGFEEHAKIAYQDEQNIIKTSKSLIDAVEKEVWDDGHISWVSTTKNPLLDLNDKTVGTFGISRDITKNKQVELEMIKRKGWLENFFKFHPTGFFVFDQNGQISYASNSVLSKLNKANVEGMAFEEIFENKDFGDFLLDIDFEGQKDKEIEITLILNGKTKEQLSLLAIAGGKENEDGTQNIFLIQR